MPQYKRPERVQKDTVFFREKWNEINVECRVVLDGCWWLSQPLCDQNCLPGQTSGISLHFRSGSLRSLSRESRERERDQERTGGGTARRRSFLLNTSYSSEEVVGGPAGSGEWYGVVVVNCITIFCYNILLPHLPQYHADTDIYQDFSQNLDT